MFIKSFVSLLSSLSLSAYFLKFQFSDLYVHIIQRGRYGADDVVNLINDARYKHLLLSSDSNEFSYSTGAFLDLFDFYFNESIRDILRAVSHKPDLFNPDKGILDTDKFLQKCTELNKEKQDRCASFSDIEVANLLNDLYKIGHFTARYQVSLSKARGIESQRNEIIESFMKHELMSAEAINIRTLDPYPLSFIGFVFIADTRSSLKSFLGVDVYKFLEFSEFPLTLISDLCVYKGNYAEFDTNLILINEANFNGSHCSLPADYFT